MDKIANGKTVEHSTEGYIGTVVGTTELSFLFEAEGDEWEYRVRLSDGKILIASPKNLTTVYRQAKWHVLGSFIKGPFSVVSGG